MRMKLIIAALWMSAATAFAAPSYHTPRLAQMANAIALNLPDSLEANIDTDSLSTYNGRQLHIKTNNTGAVSHIGYKLFAFSDAKDPYMPIFDFIERYLLELDLRLDGRSREERMDIDQVVLAKGTLNLLDAIKPETFPNIEEITRRMFRISWNINGQELALSFPASCQLILGANAIELELTAEKDIMSMPTTLSPIDWSSAIVSKSQGLLVIEGESFISEMIRSDIFLKEIDGERKLLCDSLTPTKSISNIMVTGVFDEEIPMALRMNRYGQLVDTLEVTLQQFVSFCQSEGCKLFFGIKTINKDELSGAIFAPNDKLGYSHLLSVVFPLGILKGEDLKVKGTSYVYIPMNQVEEKFFNQFKK